MHFTDGNVLVHLKKKISFLTDLEKKYSIREILIVLLQFSQTTMIGYN